MLKRRIVRETVHTDYTTGEIITSTKVFAGSASKELFLMLRTTYGLDFLDKFKNLLQLKILLMLAKDVSDGVVRVDGVVLDKYSKDLGKSIIYIRKIIKFLADNNFIKRHSRGIYLINPEYIHKGTSDLHLKIEEYNDIPETKV